jgi:hypothetical protein
VFHVLAWAISAAFRPRAQLMAENLCLRQQSSVLQRRSGQPRLRNADRRYPIDLRRGVDRAVEAIVEDLKKNSKNVTLERGACPGRHYLRQRRLTPMGHEISLQLHPRPGAGVDRR